MKITKKWLEIEQACEGWVDYYNTINETDALKIMKRLLKDKKLDFANWTICHLLKRKNKVKHAIFAARQVLPIWEKEHPKKAAVWRTWADNPTSASVADAAGAARAARAASNIPGSPVPSGPPVTLGLPGPFGPPVPTVQTVPPGPLGPPVPTV